MDSPFDAFGLDGSYLELAPRVGSPRGLEEGTSAITLVAILFCGLAFAMAVGLALLVSSDLELYGNGDDSGGEDDDVAKIPARYPAGSRSPPAAVTEAPIKMTSSRAPVTRRQTTSRPSPPATSSPGESTSLPSVTATKPAPAPLTTITTKKMTAQPTPPATPSRITSTNAATTTTPKPPSSDEPPVPQSSIRPQSVLCTFGSRTNYGTIFPADGLCDYIVYDSIYKNNKNPLIANWDYDLYSILSKAQKTDMTKTQFGLGFAFEYRRNLTQDLTTSSLEAFWLHNVFHFGILECPAHGTKQADLDEVFVALKMLDDSVQEARVSGNSSYIVLGSETYTDTWSNYLKDKFDSVFKPDLFISLGHQLCGDPEKISCLSTPPAILEKPQGLSDTHDLYDAAQSLASINSLPGAPRLSISVSMKGRWSTLRPTSRVEIFSPCEKGTAGPFFGSYTDICNTPSFTVNVLYEAQRYAMRTFDPGTRHMFVYDDEQVLCRKLCLVKANHTNVPFGVAIYDVDYEDADNACPHLNLRDNYSRLKTVRSVANFLARKFTDPTKESQCSSLYH
ncbi:hypothetical protein MRX96_028701 [Rhipicephalus microplus]